MEPSQSSSRTIGIDIAKFRAVLQAGSIAVLVETRGRVLNSESVLLWWGSRILNRTLDICFVGEAMGATVSGGTISKRLVFLSFNLANHSYV